MVNDDDQDAVSRDLVQQATSGDAAAVAAMLERHLPALSAYVERHAGAVLKQKESRSDLVQSVCREVLEGLRSSAFVYRGEGPFRQWLFQVALHKIQGRGRFYGAERRDPAREVPLDGVASDRGGDLAQSVTPSRDVVAREELARFRAALARLDAVSQQVVQSAYFDGVPHKDIAARLQITEAHCRMLLSRALARIAKLATGGSA